jgi:hypothetical protein
MAGSIAADGPNWALSICVVEQPTSRTRIAASGVDQNLSKAVLRDRGKRRDEVIESAPVRPATGRVADERPVACGEPTSVGDLRILTCRKNPAECTAVHALPLKIG